MGGGDILEQVRQTASRVASSYGLEIFDVQYRREGQGMVLRVLIDRPGPAGNAGESVSVDDCAHVSRDLSAIFDVEEVVPARVHPGGLVTRTGSASRGASRITGGLPGVAPRS